ncbi:hypothetical protein NMY22_g3565 [Coprinellus aureogranulatus]|nr:hypothetical protein NMY22_g3565 [Coprinellus aureogranulatus]
MAPSQLPCAEADMFSGSVNPSFLHSEFKAAGHDIFSPTFNVNFTAPLPPAPVSVANDATKLNEPDTERHHTSAGGSPATGSAPRSRGLKGSAFRRANIIYCSSSPSSSRDDVTVSSVEDLDPSFLESHNLTTPQVYVRSMLKSGKGLACWKPRPRSANPGERGTVPGDVGTFTPEAGFKKTFNLWDDEESLQGSANSSGVSPFRLPTRNIVIDPEEIPRGRTIAEGASSSTIYCKSDARTIDSFEFRCQARSGAVLAATSSAELEELEDHTYLRECIVKHAELIYKHANSIRRIADNEALYIVTGCVKSDSWAIAAFKEPGIAPYDLMCLENMTHDGNHRSTYAWTKTWNSSEARFGMSDQAGLKDQTLFILGFKLDFSAAFRRRVQRAPRQPKDDPTGWQPLPKFSVRVGFRGVATASACDIECEAYIANPTTYTRGSVIPCYLVCKTPDTSGHSKVLLQAVVSQNCISMTLVQSVEHHQDPRVVAGPATFSGTVKLPASERTQHLEEGGSAVWWTPRTQQAGEGAALVEDGNLISELSLEGEIHTDIELLPSCQVPFLDVSHHVQISLQQSQDLDIAVTSAMQSPRSPHQRPSMSQLGLLPSWPVGIATAHAGTGQAPTAFTNRPPRKKKDLSAVKDVQFTGIAERVQLLDIYSTYEEQNPHYERQARMCSAESHDSVPRTHCYQRRPSHLRVSTTFDMESSEIYYIKQQFILGAYKSVLNTALPDENSPDYTSALLYKARSHIALNDPQSALNIIPQGTENVALKAVASLARYIAAKDDSSKEAALEELRDLSVEIEDEAEGTEREKALVRVLAGTAFARAGELEEALETLGTETEDLEAVAVIVQLYLSINRPDLAKKQFERSKRWAEDDLLLQLIESNIGLVTGKDGYSNSSSFYTEQLANPSLTSPHLLTARGVVRLLRNEIQEAKSDLEESLQQNKDDPETLAAFVVAGGLGALKKEETEDLWNQLTSKYPEHPLVVDVTTKAESFDHLVANLTLPPPISV